MAKKDKKSKTAEQKARVAAKQSKKATQKEKKLKSRGNESDTDVDVETVLEEYAKRQAQFLKVTEVVCEPPSPRASATLIGSPSNSNELLLFGGEYYDGSLASFYNDLYIFAISRSEWRRVTSPNSPLPRSGHAWCRGGNTGGVYLFGGEFSSPKQGTFYHYNDFWRLDESTREWTRLDSKGKTPPGRSGARMTYFKNYILLFGGFQDTSQQTKYLQDLWIYDCQNYIWHNPVLPPATQKPDPRSSCSLLPHESGAVLFGGYSRAKVNITVGKQSKGGGQGIRSALKPVVHQDTWYLRILPPPSESNAGSQPPTVRWERRKRPANLPIPPRAGATMAYHKGRGIMFGGVHDVEESEEGIDSEFFNDLVAFNIDRNRFYQMTLRKPRTLNKKPTATDRLGGRRGKGKADEAELLRNLAALETTGTIADEIDIDDFAPAPIADMAPSQPEKPVLMTMPHARFNAMLAIQDDVLYIFGGTFEQGDRELTFDEMHAIDLGKLDGVKEIFRREVENWQGSEDEDSDMDDEGDSSGEDDDDENEDEGVALPATPKADTEMALPSVKPELAVDKEEEQPESALTDSKPHPRPFESLRDFFARTSNDWQTILIDDAQQKGGLANRGVKELRKEAFEVAESKWWDCREEITALEDQQEEAGIGEVISLADRATDSSGAGRRR